MEKQNKNNESTFQCNNFFRIINKDGITENGEKTIHYFVEARPCVGIIILDGSGQILLIKRYRVTTGKIEYEIPAGFIEDDESQLNAAKRELKEETGISNIELNFLFTFEPSNGILSQQFYLFRGSIKSYSSSNKIKFIHPDLIMKQIVAGEINDSATIISTLMSISNL